jgi:hypothetical protein
LLNRFVTTLGLSLNPFLREYKAFQDKLLNESTFNDSVGNVYDEHYLEEVLLHFNIFDSIFNFEVIICVIAAILDTFYQLLLLGTLRYRSKASFTIESTYSRKAGTFPLYWCVLFI